MELSVFANSSFVLATAQSTNYFAKAPSYLFSKGFAREIYIDIIIIFERVKSPRQAGGLFFGVCQFLLPDFCLISASTQIIFSINALSKSGDTPSTFSTNSIFYVFSSFHPIIQPSIRQTPNVFGMLTL